MSKINTIYSCGKCGAQFAKWQGRCSECGAWGTIPQEAINLEEVKSKPLTMPDQVINFIDIIGEEKARTTTGLTEIDKVLGGGIVSGSLILLGGDPGIGKSTLALQIAQSIGKTLYISGEESAQQIKMRADRLNTNLEKIKFAPQTNIEKIIATIKEQKPDLAIIDSIQTVNSSDSLSGVGSTAQITACTSKLMELAKGSGISILIIGHVTKDGFVAGPKTLEHLVDTVLYLENDNQNFYKILRSVKNRFGSVGEIGIFEMTAFGLKEIKNPTDIFLGHQTTNSPGSATSVIIEGTRPFLVEIQALVAKTSFGYPVRKATGFDVNRLQMITAVIGKIAKINLSNHDIYLNVTGGLKIKETATDLAVALSIISAFLEKPLADKTLVIGEIGLSGEIRSIPQLERRIKEASKLNFNRVITAPHSIDTSAIKAEIISVRNIVEAINKINSGISN